MSHHDRKNPSTPAETTPHDESSWPPERAQTEIVTAGGVTVIVRDDPPREPEPEPEPPEQAPKVVIRPPEQAVRERDALARALVAEHGAWIRATLLRRGDVLEESAKDLSQQVLLIFTKQKKPPEHVRAFLARVIKQVVHNHKRRWRPDVDREADPDEALWSSPDPEGAMDLVQRWATVERYISSLPAVEAEVIRCIELECMGFDEAAAALNRPRGTVSTQFTRAWARLKAFARRSERGAA